MKNAKFYLPIVLFLNLTLLACTHEKKHRLEDVEKACGLKLQGKVSLEKIDDEWNRFQNNGEIVAVYDIQPNCLEQIYADAQYWAEGDKTQFSELELKYVRGDVLFTSHFRANEIERVIVDTTHKRLTYYYAIM
jgi:hypothetical protein